MEQFIKHNVIYFANAQAHGFISMAAFLANSRHCMVSIMNHSSVVCALISDEFTGTLKSEWLQHNLAKLDRNTLCS